MIVNTRIAYFADESKSATNGAFSSSSESPIDSLNAGVTVSNGVVAFVVL